jgi:hypothetical protein
LRRLNLASVGFIVIRTTTSSNIDFESRSGRINGG